MLFPKMRPEGYGHRFIVFWMWFLGYKLSKGSGPVWLCGWGGAEGRWVGWEQAPPPLSACCSLPGVEVGSGFGSQFGREVQVRGQDPGSRCTARELCLWAAGFGPPTRPRHHCSVMEG